MEVVVASGGSHHLLEIVGVHRLDLHHVVLAVQGDDHIRPAVEQGVFGDGGLGRHHDPHPVQGLDDPLVGGIPHRQLPGRLAIQWGLGEALGGVEDLAGALGNLCDVEIVADPDALLPLEVLLEPLDQHDGRVYPHNLGQAILDKISFCDARRM